MGLEGRAKGRGDQPARAEGSPGSPTWGAIFDGTGGQSPATAAPWSVAPRAPPAGLAAGGGDWGEGCPPSMSPPARAPPSGRGGSVPGQARKP